MEKGTKYKMTPLEIFKMWFEEELKLSKAQIPTAVCLSTVGSDNHPNARFVSYKEIMEDSFIITGPLNSRKGTEIEQNNNVALTFWWTETERQVRIQGVATKLSEQLSDKYFNERDRNSQAVSSVCEQGKEVGNMEQLQKKVLDKAREGIKINRPSNWGGFSIKPIRIEFMEFKQSRFHHRNLYEIENDGWKVKQIQP